MLVELGILHPVLRNRDIQARFKPSERVQFESRRLTFDSIWIVRSPRDDIGVI